MVASGASLARSLPHAACGALYNVRRRDHSVCRRWHCSVHVPFDGAQPCGTRLRRGHNRVLVLPVRQRRFAGRRRGACCRLVHTHDSTAAAVQRLCRFVGPICCTQWQVHSECCTQAQACRCRWCAKPWPLGLAHCVTAQTCSMELTLAPLWVHCDGLTGRAFLRRTRRRTRSLVRRFAIPTLACEPS